MNHRVHTIAACLLLAGIPAPPALSQSPAPKMEFRRISLEHGLPSARVNVITQTRDGVMWFGTREGFCKYEKGAVTVYAPNAGEGSTVAGNDVRAMYEDRSGILWIGLFGGGVYQFDRTSGKLVNYRSGTTAGSLSDSRVLSILEDRTGTLWIGTVNGLNTFDRTNLLFVRQPPPDAAGGTLPEQRIWPLIEDRSGNLWIGTLGGGLVRFEIASGVLTTFRHDPAGANSIAANAIVALFLDRSGRLWIGHEKAGVDEFISERDEFDRLRQEFRHHLHGMSVSSVAEDLKGNILVGTLGSGLKVLDRATRVVTTVANDPSDPKSLGDNTVRSLFVDASGVLWVGTETAGVNVGAPAEPSKPGRGK